LAWTFLCFAATPLLSAPNYIVRAWYAEDGLPQNAVTAAVQTHDGYLWLGTYTGLVRFDGARFVVFDDINTPALKNSRITSLYESADGTLWIGHETGDVTRFKAGCFEAVPLKAGWTGGKIFSIGADDVGDIWLMNPDGLLTRVRDGKLLSPEAGAIQGVFAMTGNRQGVLWVNRNGKVSELRQGELHVLQFEPGRTDCFAFGLCASRDGQVWVEADSRIRKWDGKQWVDDRGPAPWGMAPVASFAELSNGYLAAGTGEQGLFLISPTGQMLHFNRTNGLSHNWVRCLWEDREGNLWAGTGTGLSMLRRSNLSVVSPPDEWQGCAVLSVTTGQDGSLWVGTEGAGIYQWREGVWSHFTSENSGLKNHFVWSLAEDEHGQLWAGTWGGGLFVRRNDHFDPAPQFGSFFIPAPALLRARDGGLWIGTGEGLLRYKSNHVATFGRDAGIVSPDVRSIVEAANGTVWFGMYAGGLGCLQNGQVRQFRKRDGLASDFVQCLKLETNGTLWIGTFGGGLSRLKNGLFTSVGMEKGLPNSVICHIEDDGLGNFWMSSYGGILRVAKGELEACADGKLSKVHCLVYGEGDGLPTLECSGGLQPAGCRSKDGRLWFPTSKGMAVVDPGNVTTNLLPPPVVIEEFRVDGRLITNTGPSALQIEPGHRRFDIQYTALSFISPERVRFRCRLEGSEEDWVDAGKRRDANYTFVPPGDYVFHVTACNNDGIWNEQGVSFAFRVLPHFWQTGWFRAVTIVSLVVLAGGMTWFETRRRMHRRIERLERRRALERERARIANDIHDDLGASLTQITLLSQSALDELGNAPQAAARVDRIYTTARELTRAMDEIVWAVNPQHDTLDSLAIYLGKFSQDYLRAAGIRCRLRLPEQLPSQPLTADMRHNLFLAAKEALNNIVKHASAAEVQITLTLAENSFTWEVEDNGHGFSSTAVPHGSPDRLSSGNGLTSMHRRMGFVGGRCEVQSTPGAGTRVRFWLPSKGAS
jgi:signal transduction histidine kinase/ligand-binding sensor domain-containing protein